MGGLKQPVTHTQRETTEIIQQCIWTKGYNPDLIFVSSNISDMCDKSVLDPIPRTPHRPICVTVNPVIVPQPTTSRRHFYNKKTNLDEYLPNFMQPSKTLIRFQKTMEGS